MSRSIIDFLRNHGVAIVCWLLSNAVFGTVLYKDLQAGVAETKSSLHRVESQIEEMDDLGTQASRKELALERAAIAEALRRLEQIERDQRQYGPLIEGMRADVAWIKETLRYRTAAQ